MKKRHNDNCDECGGNVRALANSAGIQFGDLLSEAHRMLDKVGPDQEKAYYECIRQLARGGAVSNIEQRTLFEIGKRGFTVASDGQAKKFLAYVQSLHKRMQADRNASPVALAITGAIANFISPPKPGRRARVMAKQSQHPVRDILLGVAGGAFGGLQMSGWNPIGGVVGGVVGGAIAAVKALC